MSLHMLIADDSATNRLLFSATITRMGHQADVVATGREAIELFHKNAYDLVFLDINMPGMGGVATAAEIHPINKRHTPVYAISGWIDANIEDRLIAAGVRDCLIKPLDRDKLNRIIDDCQLQNRTQPPAAAAPDDIPKRLLGVYAQELRSRAQASERYFADGDTSALLREAHTLRALADMLKTPEVEKSAALLEKTCCVQLHLSPEERKTEPLAVSAIEDLMRACHLAARTIEKLI